MDKTIIALGLMSGTSMDGIDASLLRSNGEEYVEIIGNLYVKYDPELKNLLYNFSSKINSFKDLQFHQNEYENLEREVTIKHAEISLKLCKEYNIKPQLIGFHGQTILHKPQENYSLQMGNAKLLSQLLRTDVVYQFRQNDIKNGGDGAPLTPIYHHSIKKKLNFKKPVVFLNIGGIANFTFIDDDIFFAKDIGPGNCLMDLYIKKTKKLEFDVDGNFAALGKVDNVLVNSILEQENYNSKQTHSLDIKDFDINFVKGLSIEDALANLNFFSAKMISENLQKEIIGDFIVILCGGGRKNKTLVSNIKKTLNKNILNIDDFNIDGDFIESQAFGYLSIRSLYKKFISFPTTTKVKEPVTGGNIVKYLK